MSLFLLFVDSYTNRLQSVRMGLSIFTDSLHYVVDWPIQTFGSIFTEISSNYDIAQENEALKKQIIFLQNKIQNLNSLKDRNQQLLGLFHAKAQMKNIHTTLGRILAVNNNQLLQQYTVNKGTLDGIQIDQIVVDAQGIVGQINKTNYSTSEVLLITDPRSSIYVQNTRNQLRGIAVGDGASGTLSLTNLPADVDIRKGDLLVTSGLDKKFFYGHPVGVVIGVDRKQGNGFAIIKVKPASLLERLNYVLLLEAKSVKE